LFETRKSIILTAQGMQSKYYRVSVYLPRKHVLERLNVVERLL